MRLKDEADANDTKCCNASTAGKGVVSGSHINIARVPCILPITYPQNCGNGMTHFCGRLAFPRLTHCMQLCFKDAPAAEWNEVFPDASSEAVDLLSHLVQWNPGKVPCQLPACV